MSETQTLQTDSGKGSKPEKSAPLIEKTGKSRKKLRKILFAALLGVSTIAGPSVASSGALERAAASKAIAVLSDPQELSNDLIEVAHLLGNEKDNPDFKPIDTMVADALSNFKAETGMEPFFVHSKEFRAWSFYSPKIEFAAESVGIIAESPESLALKILNTLPDEIQQKYRESQGYIFGYHDAALDGSGMWTRIKKSGIDLSNDSQIANETKKYFEEAKSYVENLVNGNHDSPISAENLFTFFLKKNGGNIAESLLDTSTFLKFSSRNNFDTGNFVGNDPSQNVDNQSWMKKNILDEYGNTNFNTSSISEDTNNLIGKPYHTWNLLASLADAPSQVTTIVGMRAQINYVVSQGPAKIESDLITLAQLTKIEQSFEKNFSTTPGS